MLNKKIVSTELYKFAINYSIKPDIKTDENGKEIWEYAKFLYEDLQREGFTDADFVEAIREIKRQNTKMYNAMPNLAIFLEHSTKKPPSVETIAHDKASQVFGWLVNNVEFWRNDYFGDGKERLSENQDYGHEFEEDLQYVVDREFGSTSGLIKAYGEAYLSGFSNLFKKDLIGAFKIQGNMLQSGLVAIADEKQKGIDYEK